MAVEVNERLCYDPCNLEFTNALRRIGALIELTLQLRNNKFDRTCSTNHTDGHDTSMP